MQDIQSTIAQMSLEEKAALCIGASAWTTTSVERLGVPSIFMADGPHGLRRVSNVNVIGGTSLPATCFPTATCLASTWNVDLVRELGQALGNECIGLRVDVLLGPGNNMKRTPVCGRNFEYYSEDPYLSGEMAASFIDGIQSKGIGASLKHFAVNNQETQRMCISAEVDERTLREIYLPAFETAVKKAQPWTVMCAYNKLNGIYCSEHHELLVDILKNEWGFDGLVVSDWGSVHDRVAALKGGVDLEMPGPKELRVKSVVDAIRSGSLDEAVLDESVHRVLRIVFKAAETPKASEFSADAHHKLARRLAAEGIVLLKNDGILPLRNIQRIAVIGRAAKEPHLQGGGSSHVNPTQVEIPFDELKKAAIGTDLIFAEGYPTDNSHNQDLIEQAASAARGAQVALVYIALPSFKESEGYDRTDLDLTAQQVALIKAVTESQPKTVVILNTGSAVTMSDWLDGTAAVIDAWMMGQAGGGAIADVLFGIVNPSGKLPETFPVKLTQTPAYINFPGGSGQVRYGEGIFIGYRYYDATETPVLFPFGYGQSYTSFAYSNLEVSTPTFKDIDGLTIKVNVTNTGSMAGKEVVQVYVHQGKSKLVRPPKELKGFAKVELQPGETKTVSLHLDARAFSYYHPAFERWITESGEFDILIGASAADIRCTQTITLQSTLELPCILNRESTLREWLEDPHGKPILEPLFETMKTRMVALLGGTEADNGSMALDPLTMIMDMPLRDIFHFQESALPVPVDELIDSLLAKARGGT